MDKKKLLKGAGKVALSVAVPPVGLPLWFKDYENKGGAVFAGLSLSVAYGCFTPFLWDNELNSKPHIVERRFYQGANTFLSALGSFNSPIVSHILLNKKGTLVETNKGYSLIEGKVISYNKENSKYEVMFGESSNFSGGGSYLLRVMPTDMSSMADAVSDLEIALRGGDVLGSRDSEGALKEKRAFYDATSEALRNVVSQLNDELETRRLTLEDSR